jgi:hypothetical protein
MALAAGPDVIPILNFEVALHGLLMEHFCILHPQNALSKSKCDDSTGAQLIALQWV